MHHGDTEDTEKNTEVEELLIDAIVNPHRLILHASSVLLRVLRVSVVNQLVRN